MLQSQGDIPVENKWETSHLSVTVKGSDRIVGEEELEWFIVSPTQFLGNSCPNYCRLTAAN